MSRPRQQPHASPVAPQNLEAEESVLGAMMLSPTAIAAVSEVLRPGDFYRESHSKVYQAALDLDARGKPVDAITLADFLEERGELDDIGGRIRVHELAALVPAAGNAAHYAGIVQQMAHLRGLIAAGGEIARLGWERPGEVPELFDLAERALYEVSKERASADFVALESLLKEGWEQINALYDAKSDVSGLATGFRDLDHLTSGFQPGNLIVVAARPSMGKSALALCMGVNVALAGRPVALFTLEMSKNEVVQRLMCSEAKVQSQRLRNGRLAAEDWARLTAACDRLSKARMYVDESGAPTLTDLRSKVRRLHAREPGLALIIIDYLQLMAPAGTNAENRVQQVGEITRSLKVLAREVGVPIVALSQLSRAVEQRHDRRPLLSDLRESGSIEQDADLVLFIYRDDYYDEDSEHQGVAELILAKHRNGPTDTVKAAFLKRYAKFADLADEPAGRGL